MKPMFGHRAKVKRFEYKPRYYDPEKDPANNKRIEIKRLRKRSHQGRSVLMYALGLALVVWLITLL